MAIRRGLTEPALLECFHIGKAVFDTPAYLDELRADANPSPPLQRPAGHAEPAREFDLIHMSDFRHVLWPPCLNCSEGHHAFDALHETGALNCMKCFYFMQSW
jgi:hypothetical protein